MGYLVHGRLDTGTIAVTARDARDAAKQASELVKRGAHDIRIQDQSPAEHPIEAPERSLGTGPRT